ncbi:hypothetical protein BDZ85DRAFT_286525 [Elsinoe ampelina]|uniref:Uncharacterized protein n=1 Tax=Elsinoe ampelina TaxID=302913 RepID=A0A6A6FXL9_9PEZI|nr:hypothetical protein BDZ85DRAFT_286525 [Elsinoe ampelina]
MPTARSTRLFIRDLLATELMISSVVGALRVLITFEPLPMEEHIDNAVSFYGPLFHNIYTATQAASGFTWQLFSASWSVICIAWPLLMVCTFLATGAVWLWYFWIFVFTGRCQWEIDDAVDEKTRALKAKVARKRVEKAAHVKMQKKTTQEREGQVVVVAQNEGSYGDEIQKQETQIHKSSESDEADWEDVAEVA